MSQSIHMTLLSQQAKRITFNIVGVTVQGRCFAEVAGLIANRTVKVRKKTDPRLGNYRICLYDPLNNQLTIHTSSKTFPNGHAEESLIIHEAVHITNDLRCKSLSLLNDEVAAHVAQAMYILLVADKQEREKIIRSSRGGLTRKSNACASSPTMDICSTGRLQAAALIADALIKKSTPSNGFISLLKNNISNDPSYKNKAKITKYDGIPGAPGSCVP